MVIIKKKTATVLPANTGVIDDDESPVVYSQYSINNN